MYWECLRKNRSDPEYRGESLFCLCMQTLLCVHVYAIVCCMAVVCEACCCLLTHIRRNTQPAKALDRALLQHCSALIAHDDTVLMHIMQSRSLRTQAKSSGSQLLTTGNIHVESLAVTNLLSNAMLYQCVALSTILLVCYCFRC
jgi:hypothetical protein